MNFRRICDFSSTTFDNISFRRVLVSEHIDDKIKKSLKREYDSLNPVELKRNITRLQDKLLKLNTLKQKVEKEMIINAEAYGYITR